MTKRCSHVLCKHAAAACTGGTVHMDSFSQCSCFHGRVGGVTHHSSTAWGSQATTCTPTDPWGPSALWSSRAAPCFTNIGKASAMSFDAAPSPLYRDMLICDKASVTARCWCAGDGTNPVRGRDRQYVSATLSHDWGFVLRTLSNLHACCSKSTASSVHTLWGNTAELSACNHGQDYNVAHLTRMERGPRHGVRRSHPVKQKAGQVHQRPRSQSPLCGVDTVHWPRGPAHVPAASCSIEQPCS